MKKIEKILSFFKNNLLILINKIKINLPNPNENIT